MELTYMDKSGESDSISESLNEDFDKFLNEPLSTSESNEVSTSEIKILTDVGEPKIDESNKGSSHSWLKKKPAESTGTIGISRLSPELRVQVLKKSRSSSEEDTLDKEPSISLQESDLIHEELSLKSSDSDVNSSFQADLKKAIDHSLQEKSSEDDHDYSNTFEGSEEADENSPPSHWSEHKDEQLLSSKGSDYNNKKSLSSEGLDLTDDKSLSTQESEHAEDKSVSLRESETKDISKPFDIPGLEEYLKGTSAEKTEIAVGLVQQIQEAFLPDSVPSDYDTKNLIKSPLYLESSEQNLSSSYQQSHDLSESEPNLLSQDLVMPGKGVLEETEHQSLKKYEMLHLEDEERVLSVLQNEKQVISTESTTGDGDELGKTSLVIPSDIGPPSVSKLHSLALSENDNKSKTLQEITDIGKRSTDNLGSTRNAPAVRVAVSTSAALGRTVTMPKRQAASSSSTGTAKRGIPTTNIIQLKPASSPRRTPASRTSNIGRGRGRIQSNIPSPEVSNLKKQLADQERLLTGLQVENEKLYEDMKIKTKELQVLKETHMKEKEHLAWQLGNAKENIRYLEFGKHTSGVSCNPDDCEHSVALSEMKKENIKVKEELESIKVKQVSDSTHQYNYTVREEEQVLRGQLNKMEKMATDLQLRLTKAQESENSLKARINILSRKQTSSQTVSFLEDQLKEMFKFQVDQDNKVKSLLDDIREQQESLKNAYQDALREAEENLLQQRLQLQIKLAEENSLGGHAAFKKNTNSKCIQCNSIDNAVSKTSKQKLRKAEENKAVQCYLIHDLCSNLSLENEELKLRMERITMENEGFRSQLQRLSMEKEDYNSQIQNYLMSFKSKESKTHKCTTLNILTKETQLQTAMESQQILLEQVQRRLEYVQSQWEEQIHENTTLRERVQQTTSQLVKLEQTCQGLSPELQGIISLERKILELEKRHAQREEELLKLQYQASQKTPEYLRRETEKWQEQVLQKNQLINDYRRELDSIIAFLYQLQQQNTDSQDW